MLPGSAPDQFEFGNFMSVTLSCDHRVIDGLCYHLTSILLNETLLNLTANSQYSNLSVAGAVGAEWLGAFKSYIESPQSMLL